MRCLSSAVDNALDFFVVRVADSDVTAAGEEGEEEMEGTGDGLDGEGLEEDGLDGAIVEDASSGMGCEGVTGDEATESLGIAGESRDED